MITKIFGKITSIFADDINTDDIIPAWTLQESTDKAFFAKYAFSNYDKEFIKRCQKEESNIVVAGKNFGCGSSREQAVYALQYNNVKAVISYSYPDIFYRNCLNNGLAALIIDEKVNWQMNKEIIIDFEKKKIFFEGKEIEIKNPDEDIKTFMLGGKISKIRQKVETIIEEKEKKVDWTKNKIKVKKGQTIVEKIVSSHLGKEVYVGEKVDLPIDILFFNEVIGPPAIKDFQSQFGDIFEKHQKPIKVFDPKRVFLFLIIQPLLHRWLFLKE
jgi:3-isopropylmalate dehydratase small subunit